MGNMQDTKNSKQKHLSLKEFMDKVKKMEKGELLDLSSDEDLSIAIMNLISIEEHLFFTANKTRNKKYFDLLDKIRSIRKSCLKDIIKDYEGEVWCISKHLLASSMRLMEVGTKALTANKKAKAYSYFSKSYSLYCLFWALNIGGDALDSCYNDIDSSLNLDVEFESSKEVKAKRQKQNDKKQANSHTASNKKTKKSFDIIKKAEEFFKNAVDCCKE